MQIICHVRSLRSVPRARRECIGRHTATGLITRVTGRPVGAVTRQPVAHRPSSRTSHATAACSEWSDRDSWRLSRELQRPRTQLEQCTVRMRTILYLLSSSGACDDVTAFNCIHVARPEPRARMRAMSSSVISCAPLVASSATDLISWRGKSNDSSNFVAGTRPPAAQSISNSWCPASWWRHRHVTCGWFATNWRLWLTHSQAVSERC